MKAIILAGGLGTRLRSVAKDVPKPMIEIKGQPFLSILIDYLSSQGISDVILAVGYLKEIIINYFNTSYNVLKISYSIEKEGLLGTGGSIVQALDFVGTEENIFIINGDTFCPINYKDFYQYHIKNKSNFSMVLKKIGNTSRYGNVEFNKNCIINSFVHKKEEIPGWINSGIYLINKSIFNKFSLPKKFSFEIDFMQKYTNYLNILAFLTNAYFIDIGIPEDYERFCKTMLQQKI